MPTAREILEGKQKPEITQKPQIVYRYPKEPKKAKIPKHKLFIVKYCDHLIKALFNARNTIRNKKEVVAKDESKQYYRDFLLYKKMIEELNEFKEEFDREGK